MQKNELEKSLAFHLRHMFGDCLDLHLLSVRREETLPTSSRKDPASALAEYANSIRFCQNCAIHIGRDRLVFGRGHWDAKIVFLGDFPSATDDKTGEPFSDEDGELLNKMILAMKLRPEDAYLANIYKCRPATGTRIDASHFLACETHLKTQFSFLRAPVVVALGEIPSRALARAESPLQVLRKQVFDWEGRKVVPTHHPRVLHQNAKLKKEAWEDLQAAMRLMEKI